MGCPVAGFRISTKATGIKPGPPNRPIGLATNLHASAQITPRTLEQRSNLSPFVIALRDDDYRLSFHRIQLIRSLRLEVVLHHGIRPASSARQLVEIQDD